MVRGRLPVLIVLLISGNLPAERLPVQFFSTTHGLPSNTILRIVKDRRGFLWFCTGEGLARFDGNTFQAVDTRSGLPGPAVWDFEDTQGGDAWVATSGGLARLRGSALFDVRHVRIDPELKYDVVLGVRETSDSTLWAATKTGLYRTSGNQDTFVRVPTGPPPKNSSEPAVAAIEEDGAGDLWFGGTSGIGRVRRNGDVELWQPRTGWRPNTVETLFRDSDGTIWAGTEVGPCHLLANARNGEPLRTECYGPGDGLPGRYTQAIWRASDGRLWIGTVDGAAHALPKANGRLQFTSVTTKNGLKDDDIDAIAEDTEGNIWLGAADDGAMKISREPVTLFDTADGLHSLNVVGVIEDADGRLCAITRSASTLAVYRFDGTRFTPVKLDIPRTIRSFGRGLQQVALQDRQRSWWLATAAGLLRCPAETGHGCKIVAGNDGNSVFRLYLDTRGDIWWSSTSWTKHALMRWIPRLRAAVPVGSNDGLPPLHSNLPSALVEDRNGIVWLGFESQGIARRRGDGTFEYFNPAGGHPAGRIRAAVRDVRGRLWFGTSSGLWRLDDPAAEKPEFRRYTAASGLSSNTVHSIVDDLEGRIYVGTGHGVDRLHPDSGRVEHISTADGLPDVLIQAAYRDRTGHLWFATRHGLARYNPEAAEPGVTPPEPIVTSCRVRGVERSPVRAPLSLPFSDNQLEFSFTAPWFRARAPLSYQYRLEGAASPTWSSPSKLRTVNFATLSPGRYQFLVRAVDDHGAASAPASVSFHIHPPIWLTWWFEFGAACAIAAGLYALYRYRMHTVLEREQLRLRLAADLHDDIGSSLSSIAIWSEVAEKQAAHQEALARQMRQIGMAARDVIDAVSDMVWAVNPRNDRFEELSSRMRLYAGEMSAAADRTITFVTSGDGTAESVGPAVRREVFLVFKEALNNVLRHSGSNECTVSLAHVGRTITLRVTDQGTGFDMTSCRVGNGLETMRRRAERLGGRLTVQSTPSTGAEVELTVPLRSHRTHLFRWGARA